MPLTETAAGSETVAAPQISTPTVSVVVCAFSDRRRDELLDALRSLRQQTRAAHEVIVVIDHNPGLLEWIQGRDQQIVAIENSFERGLSGARNTGVREASGSVIAFLDDDAIADPAWIESIATDYADPQVLGAGGSVLPLWEQRPGWFPEEFAWVVGCTYRGLPTRRSAVRNVIGCNMSFRREVFEELGGFTTRLGRIGAKPLGGEETELCIRIGKHAPDRTVLYDPAMSVHHRVPRERSTLRYFLSRCYSEGISKAELARLAGTDSGLSSERSYALRTLPAGVWTELKAAFRGGDAAALGRAGAMMIGLGATVAGFVAGSRHRSRAPEAAAGVSR